VRVITAAHCFVGGHDISVIAGLNTVTISGRITLHESYDDNTVLNDIALVKLNEPLPCDNPNIQPVSFFSLHRNTELFVFFFKIALLDKSNGFDINGCSAWATGFGDLYSGGSSPVHEFDNFEVQTKIYDTAFCNQAPESYYTELPSTQLCGFTTGNPNEDTCQGKVNGRKLEIYNTSSFF
jgi:secreted trypsin-like serine protease